MNKRCCDKTTKLQILRDITMKYRWVIVYFISMGAQIHKSFFYQYFYIGHRTAHMKETLDPVGSIWPPVELLPSTCHAAVAWRPGGSNSNAGKMDQTWSKETLCHLCLRCVSLYLVRELGIYDFRVMIIVTWLWCSGKSKVYSFFSNSRYW